MPGWIEYPFSANRYITAPQAKAEKMEKCVGEGGIGLTTVPAPGLGGGYALGSRVTTTLETT